MGKRFNEESGNVEKPKKKKMQKKVEMQPKSFSPTLVDDIAKLRI